MRAVSVQEDRRSTYAMGVFLLTLGVLLLVDRTGFDIPSPIWASLGAAVAFASLSHLRQSPVWALIGGLLGIVMFTNGVGITYLNLGRVWTYAWPLFLIAVGLYLIGSLGERGKGSSVVNIMDDFRGGDGESWDLTDRTVWSVLGDIELDLARARIPEGTTHLKLNSVIGDTLLFVPESVGVEVVASNVIGTTDIFGHRYEGLMRSVNHRTSKFVEAPKRVRIQVHSVIGDVHIRRVG